MAETVTVEEARDMALEKTQEVIDAWDECIAAGKTIKTRATVDIKAEELIEVLLQNFPHEISVDQARQVFDGGFAALSRVDLAKLPDEQVPVALMREVLHNKKVMFNPKNVTNWNAFVARFGPAVIAVKYGARSHGIEW